ncbi:MAG: hypothetical protein ABIH03_08670 [Pseudomonadota bacterium]
MQHETRQKLKDLLARTAHVLDVEDFDDIAELDRLAKKITDPGSGLNSPLTEHAVYVRGVPVYPLTLAHLTYLDEAPDLLGLAESDRVALMLWILTQPEITDAHYDADSTRKALRAWARRCRWTEKDISGVMELRYRRMIEADGENAKDGTDSALIGLLCREYGDAPDYWIHRAAVGVIEACVADWNRQQEAQAAAYRKASKGGGVAPPPSPKFVAMRKFRECSEKLEAKWLAKNHS